MLCIHNSHFIFWVQYINGMVTHIYALDVVQHMLRFHSSVKGDRIAQLGVQRFVKRIIEEYLCLPFFRLVCVPVGGAGTMDGLGFGTDHTGRAFGDQFVVYRWTCRTR